MNITHRKQPSGGHLTTATTHDPFRMMRDMIRWDPFRELGTLFSNDASGAIFMPNVDVKETADAYVFKADVPGIKEKDVEVALVGNRLTVSGKREEERREEKETYYATERSYGSFTRTFTMPDGTDPEHARADLKEGVLTITVPKKPEVQPKKIAIGAGTDKPQAKA